MSFNNHPGWPSVIIDNHAFQFIGSSPIRDLRMITSMCICSCASVVYGYTAIFFAHCDKQQTEFSNESWKKTKRRQMTMGLVKVCLLSLISDNSRLKLTKKAKKSSVKTIFRNSDESWCYFGRNL